MGGGVGGGREDGTGLDGCGSGLREKGIDRTGLMGEWDEGERKGQGRAG